MVMCPHTTSDMHSRGSRRARARPRLWRCSLYTAFLTTTLLLWLGSCPAVLSMPRGCAEGSIYDQTVGQCAACSPCPRGFEPNETSGCWGTHDSYCEECPDNYFKADASLQQCQPCTQLTTSCGLFERPRMCSKTGDGTCTAKCPDGKFWNSATNSCDRCTTAYDCKWGLASHCHELHNAVCRTSEKLPPQTQTGTQSNNMTASTPVTTESSPGGVQVGVSTNVSTAPTEEPVTPVNEMEGTSSGRTSPESQPTPISSQDGGMPLSLGAIVALLLLGVVVVATVGSCVYYFKYKRKPSPTKEVLVFPKQTESGNPSLGDLEFECGVPGQLIDEGGAKAIPNPSGGGEQVFTLKLEEVAHCTTPVTTASSIDGIHIDEESGGGSRLTVPINEGAHVGSGFTPTPGGSHMAQGLHADTERIPARQHPVGTPVPDNGRPVREPPLGVQRLHGSPVQASDGQMSAVRNMVQSVLDYIDLLLRLRRR